MYPGNLKVNGHSAQVHIQLLLNGKSLQVSQLGPDFLVLKDRFAHPPANGEIAMSIDDHKSRWQVRLVEGISATQRKTRISSCQETNGATV